MPTYRYDGLVPVPSEVPVVKSRLGRRGPSVSGAVAPLWFTVAVPEEAKAGRYRGTVTVSADGLDETKVPLELEVSAWMLADANDFRIRTLAAISPENVAKYYGVEFWSDRHFDLLGQVFRLMADVGSRRVEINLATNFHGVPGNSQSVVRWIKKEDGGYDYDFSVLEKFLDCVEKSIGSPRPLRLNCWGMAADQRGHKGWGKYVTVIDPKTGELSQLEQPAVGAEESIAFWKPVIDGIRQRVSKRGWEELTTMGFQSYCWNPTPPTVEVCNKIWPGAVWSYTAHNGQLGSSWKGSGDTRMYVRYSECVWTEGKLRPRGYRDLFKRKDPNAVWNSVARNRHRPWSPLTTLRRLTERMIMMGHDGVGQLGAGLFPIKDKSGRYWHLNRSRGGLGPECSTINLIAPGPDGPIVTERYEQFREGVQLAEAILFLEGALQTDKISGDLAKRVNDYLDARGEAVVRGWWDKQPARDAMLLALAGEVVEAIAAAK
jgi:hypothetical protein